MEIKIEIIDGEFSVCKVWDFSQVNFEAEYCFTGKTDDEKSLVCLTEDVPENTAVRDDGWRAFRVQGVLAFSLIGILSRISAVLAESGVGIFAISTYNTDYILTKRDNWEMALQAIKKAGWGMRAQ